MKIHEYQAKGILKKYGVAVPRGELAESREQAEAAARTLLAAGATGVVVKAQIHAGGRGKGGGVKIAKSVEEASEIASKMLGMTLITHQTGAEGRIVKRLLIEETLPIEKELYLGIVIDRAEARPVFMASAAGGMEIEQVAAENPAAILKEYIDPGMGLEAFQARKLAFALGLKPQQINQAVQFMTGLYKAFEETDSSLMEINPFITCSDGRLFALDAKMNFDDNAMFRHPDLRELRDTAEQVTHAFEILLSDKNVRAVLINIFGGILRVDTLATGVVEAAKKTQMRLPVVLRLEGTNVEAGREILKQSGFNFIVAETMKDAADKVVAAANASA
jgi:succinyl-CoA synthetase beta subunit